ncbi:ESX secretion-associated protein EspG [Actinophytocola xanthii]|uniref:ESX secretion-associated protein EspG n=1 Tax=Actinophytocola xanthii TaxID=1912961 RepID=A0A1Q8CRT6_9PSEU|nr:ESX secretion-associated protein EspG [Actinophytocola xanthii]OLF17082.1 hypothetical protein BU204_13400 [Actinophytocola xanthii]
MVLPKPVTVPAAQLAALLTDHGLGEPHKVLAPEARWLPPAGHDALRRQSRELLGALGWRDRTGRLDREVAAALAVLCRPQVEYYGWLVENGHTIGVLAARIGREAVVAVREADSTVWMRSIHHTELAERLVEQTPPVPAGPGTRFTVSPAEVRATTPDGRQLTTSGVGMRRAGPEVRLAQHLARLPSGGHGELSVARRDELGRRQRAQRPLRYTDTSEGRFALVFDGHGQVSVEPAGQVELVRHLVLMERSLSA